ncbi:hypothetical protein [Bdellovibrio bacteriovorus]|uniref:hypothetical protein n=1 Tax=Bdellovibrio TaxID=958 RepID=UPI0035A92394
MKQLIALLFLFPCLSFASGGDWYEKGNGGFVLMCGPGQLQVFDLYEAQVRYRMQFDPKSLASLDERVQYLLSKFEKHNASRAVLYRKWYREFFVEAEFISNAKFNPIGDIGFGYIPKNCSLEQVIFQRAPSILNYYRYAINKDIWDSLNVENQAALVLHELIYRELTLPPNSHESSEAARYFNALLSSTRFQYLTYGQYISTLQELRFTKADYQDVKIILGEKRVGGGWAQWDLEFYDEAHLKSAILDNVQSLRRGKFIYDSRCIVDDLAQGSVAYFHPQGQLKLLAIRQVSPDACSLPYYDYENGETKIRLQGSQWQFNEKGQLLTMGGNYTFNNPVQRYFHFNGFTFEFFARPQSIVPVLFDFDGKGRIVQMMLGTMACFDPRRSVVMLSVGPSFEALGILFSSEHLEDEIKALKACSP